MLDPKKIMDKAKTSSFYLWMLNILIKWMVPFNKPHGFKIVEFNDEDVTCLLPYRRSNFNHIKGLHACALATLTEFTTGALLLSKLTPDKYRIIMKRIEIDYHYQGKTDAFANFQLTNDWINEHIIDPLKTRDSIEIQCEVKILDKKEAHLTTGSVYWQIKDWSKVKTRL